MVLPIFCEAKQPPPIELQCSKPAQLRVQCKDKRSAPIFACTAHAGRLIDDAIDWHWKSSYRIERVVQ